MFVCSLTICFCLITIYDWSKTDWFLIEELKKAKLNNTNENEKNGLINSIVILSQKNKYVLLFLLAIWDPTITILYTRKEAYKFNGIPQNLIWLFFTSSFLCNLAWAILVSAAFWGQRLIAHLF